MFLEAPQCAVFCRKSPRTKTAACVKIDKNSKCPFHSASAACALGRGNECATILFLFFILKKNFAPPQKKKELLCSLAKQVQVIIFMADLVIWTTYAGIQFRRNFGRRGSGRRGEVKRKWFQWILDRPNGSSWKRVMSLFSVMRLFAYVRYTQHTFISGR